MNREATHEITACYFPKAGEVELTWLDYDTGEEAHLTAPIGIEQGEQLAQVVPACVYSQATVKNESLQANFIYKRKEDMSPEGELAVILQPDGDVCISVYGTGMISDTFNNSNIEFCSCGMGGGKSPKTLKALKALALAIKEDNEENPIAKR